MDNDKGTEPKQPPSLDLIDDDLSQGDPYAMTFHTPPSATAFPARINVIHEEGDDYEQVELQPLDIYPGDMPNRVDGPPSPRLTYTHHSPPFNPEQQPNMNGTQHSPLYGAQPGSSPLYGAQPGNSPPFAFHSSPGLASLQALNINLSSPTSMSVNNEALRHSVMASPQGIYPITPGGGGMSHNNTGDNAGGVSPTSGPRFGSISPDLHSEGYGSVLGATSGYERQSYYNNLREKDEVSFTLRSDLKGSLYASISRPSYIPPIIHLKVKSIFRQFDPLEQGYVKEGDILWALPRIQGFLNTDDYSKLVSTLQTRLRTESNISSSPLIISLPDFYTLLHNLQLKFILTKDLRQMSTLSLVNGHGNGFTHTPRDSDLTSNYRGNHGNSSSEPRPSDVSSMDGRTTGMSGRMTTINGTLPRAETHLDLFLQSQPPARKYDAPSSPATNATKTLCSLLSALCILPCPRSQLPCFIPCNRRVASSFGTTYIHYFNIISSLLWHNIILVFFSFFVLVPAMIRFDWSFDPVVLTRWVNGVQETYTFYPDIEGFFFGLGMEHSYLFYSDWYSPASWVLFGSLKIHLGWILFALICLILSFMFVSAHLSKTKVAVSNPRERLLTAVLSFDHSYKDKKSYRFQSLYYRNALWSITSQIKDEIQALRAKDYIDTRYRTAVRRILGMAASILFMGGCGASIIFLTINQNGLSTSIDRTVEVSVLSQFAVPLFISLLKGIVPFVVNTIVAFEKRNARGAFKHSMFRIYIMKMLFLLIVLFQTQAKSLELPTLGTITCRQTATSVSFYRMITSDVIVEACFALVLPIVWGLWYLFYYKCIRRNKGPIDSLPNHPTQDQIDEYLYINSLASSSQHDLYRSDLAVHEALIDIIYTQTLIWMAIPYTLAIPMVGIVFFFIILVCKFIQVIYMTRFPRKFVPARLQHNYTTMFLCGSLALGLLSFTVFLNTRVECGPYVYDMNNPAQNTPFQSFVRDINQLSAVSTTILFALQNPTILFLLLIFVLFMGAMYRSKYETNSKDINRLQLWIDAEHAELKSVRKQYNIRINKDYSKEHFLAFITKLPEDIQNSIATFLAREGISTMDDLVILENEEVLTLLQQWNPNIVETSPLYTFILRRIASYRKRFKPI